MTKATIFILGMLAGAMLYGNFMEYRQDKVKNRFFSDTTYTTIYDTIRYRVPVPYDSVVVRHLTKYVTVNQLVVDSTIKCHDDTIQITIPITQKEYRDSTYEAWISGYEANLDSINVFNKTVYKTATTKAKRWGLGIQAGCGIGGKGTSPYIGIGVQYNLMNW